MHEVIYRFQECKDIYGKAVEWWNAFDFGHVRIVLRSHNYYMEYEATPSDKYGKPGVVCHEVAEFSGESVRIPISDIKFNEAKRFLDEQVGKDYDKPGIVSFLIPFIKANNHAWFCSELGYQLGKRINLFFPSVIKVCPKTLYSMAKQCSFDLTTRNISLHL